MASHAFHQSFAEPFATEMAGLDAHYLLFASDGVFRLEVAERQWLLPPQRAALIAVGTPISVRTTGPATSSSVLFQPAAFSTPPIGCTVFAMSELARLMTGHAMQWGPARPADDSGANTFFSALALVIEGLSRQPLETWLPRPTSDALRAAIEHGLARLDRDITIETLADVAHMSARTLARRFEAELGMGWRAFQHRARMLRAMELLSAGAGGVTEIGLACGFASTSAFIKAFKAFAGTTPKQYGSERRP